MQGRGVTKDVTQALTHLTLAAEGNPGDPVAMFTLYRLHKVDGPAPDVTVRVRSALTRRFDASCVDPCDCAHDCSWHTAG